MPFHFRRFSVLLFVVASALPIVAQSSQCPVTLPTATPFQVPEGFPGPNLNQVFYHGTPDLWVRLSPGPWNNLPIWDIGLRQKLAWQSKDFNRTGETFALAPRPQLTIEGRRLDGNAPPLVFTGANPTFVPDMGPMIMSAVNFPTPGCWEVTGHLGNATTTFVVQVGESHNYGLNGQPVQSQGE